MKTMFGIFAALALVGVAAAHTPVDLTPLGDKKYYVEDDADEIAAGDFNVWSESNGKDGLQESASCDDESEIGSGGQDDDGRDLCEDGSLPRPADTEEHHLS